MTEKGLKYLSDILLAIDLIKILQNLFQVIMITYLI